MAAFFIDGTSKDRDIITAIDDANCFCSLLDRCGLSVIVDQVY